MNQAVDFLRCPAESGTTADAAVGVPTNRNLGFEDGRILKFEASYPVFHMFHNETYMLHVFNHCYKKNFMKLSILSSLNPGSDIFPYLRLVETPTAASDEFLHPLILIS